MISFTSVIRVPVGIASASFSLVFSLATAIIKQLLQRNRNKKKKHNRIVMLAKSKLNSIGPVTFQAIIDFEISHEEFKTIVNKTKYKNVKENIRMIKTSDELNKKGQRIKTTKLWVKLMKMHRIKRSIYF